MDIGKILADLRQERDQVGEAIWSLERLVAQGAKRRGRPPAWLAKVQAEVPESETSPVIVQAKAKAMSTQAA